MSFVFRCFLIISLLVTNNVWANNTQITSRESFKKWQKTYQTLSYDEQFKLLNTLTDYPLYPYAAAQFFQLNRKTVSPDLVSNFVRQYPNFPLTSSLTQTYLTELTNRKDWSAIISFPKDDSTSSFCRNQYALLQLNNKQDVLDSVESLWKTGKELPSACDPLLDAWSKSGKRTANMILLRVELAFEANNLKLARYLANQLDATYQTTKTHLLALLENPRKIEDFSKNIGASPFTKKIVMATFPRLAKADMNVAATLLPQLIEKQKLSQTEQNLLRKSLANSYFSDLATDEQIKWRDDYIAQSHDTTLVEKRIRKAIDDNNYKDLAYWLTQLTPEDQLKEDWQYWQARVLLDKKEIKQAHEILEKLKTNRGFYGMISAQTLKKPYIVNNQSKTPSSAQINTLNSKYDNQLAVKRIKELRLLGMMSESVAEWRAVLKNETQAKAYLDLAIYAHQKGWGDLSILATISGKLWDNWTERLPIMYLGLYKDALKDKTIPLSYALAITRQESAFNTAIQSPAGASGLMQLMPATAKETAAKVSSVTYYSQSQLFEPQTNVLLGSYFLNKVYEQNDRNRILASAAYNAGPSRVKKWLSKSGGKLDAVAFIDSIPFTETRNYVKNILVYDYIYQTILGQKKSKILTENEFSKHY